MEYIESETLELKEKYTDVICKEIVSFLNTEGGTLVIGVKDDGTVIGVEKVDETLKKISDVITMQIEPNPQDEIRSELKFEDGNTLIYIHVNQGSKNIYCQKKYGFSSSGCSVRIGTTCREMKPEQIRIRYERNFTDLEYMLKKKSGFADLSFRELKIYYEEKGFHTDRGDFESNLSLKNDNGDYNLLAELLSDKNNIPFIFVKFQGDNKAAISERNDYGCGCLLTTYNKIKTRLLAENICISDTTVRPRVDKYLFDYDSVNEAVINALVHNDWTITEPQISMYSDRIEIVSHGGLTKGLTEKQFFEGVSKPRNATLMRIFLAMGLTEHTGHGVPTIVERYGTNVFEIEENLIRCTIPFDSKVLELSKKNVGLNVGLNKTEKATIGILLEDAYVTADDIAQKLEVTKRTAERALSGLRKKGYIERIGSKRDGSWRVVKQ